MWLCTRREEYQERDREAIRAKSAETRRHVRKVAFGHAPGGPASMQTEKGRKEQTSSIRWEVAGSSQKPFVFWK